MSASGTRLHGVATVSLTQDDSSFASGVGDAVDIWDATARLESRGMSHAVAVQRGHDSTFSAAAEMMSVVVPTRASRKSNKAALHSGITASFYRVLLMVAGANICLCAMPSQAGETVMIATGAAGWIGGQIVSAVTWTGLGYGGRPAASAMAAKASGVVMAAALATAALMSTPHMLVWAAWGCVSSVLSILTSPRRTAPPMVAAACASMAARFALGENGGAIAAALVVSIGAVVAARHIKASWASKRRPAGPVWKAALLAVVQTGCQVAVLVLCLHLIGGVAFAAVALSGLIAGISTDPLLELAHLRVRAIASNPLGWARGRRAMAQVGAGVVLAVVAQAVVIALIAAQGFGIADGHLAIIAASALTAALAAGTGLLLRTDAAVGAALLAVAVEVVCLFLPSFVEAGLPLTAALVIVATGTTIATGYMAASRLSHPSAW